MLGQEAAVVHSSCPATPALSAGRRNASIRLKAGSIPALEAARMENFISSYPASKHKDGHSIIEWFGLEGALKII